MEMNNTTFILNTFRDYTDVELIQNFCNYEISYFYSILFLLICIYFFINILYFFDKKFYYDISKAFFSMLIIPFTYIFFYILVFAEILKEHHIKIIKYLIFILFLMIGYILYRKGYLKKLSELVNKK